MISISRFKLLLNQERIVSEEITEIDLNELSGNFRKSSGKEIRYVYRFKAHRHREKAWERVRGAKELKLLARTFSTNNGKDENMLAISTKQELDFFSDCDQRPGVQVAKDLYSLVTENFASIDCDQSGAISEIDITSYAGNQRLKQFLADNSDLLSSLSFSAKSLGDLLKESSPAQEKCISYTDLNTFSLLCEDINRRNFYDGNFQSLREGAGLNAAASAFAFGIVLGWTLLALLFSKLNIYLPPAEAIAVGVIATVGIPLCASMIGYWFGTMKADKYFSDRIKRIDGVLARLEKAAS